MAKEMAPARQVRGSAVPGDTSALPGLSPRGDRLVATLHSIDPGHFDMSRQAEWPVSFCMLPRYSSSEVDQRRRAYSSTSGPTW